MEEQTFSNSEMLLGFDLRRSNTEWDQLRREQFLFRDDVHYPFSTDVTVWPSLLRSPPATDFGYQDLWNNLEHLVSEASSTHVEASFHPSLIAISLIIDEAVDLNRWRADVPPTMPSERNESWALLGYDVSDKWLLSGLSNCGFIAADDIRALKNRWGPSLNEYHLFSDLESANNFRRLSTHRVPEHSPFFIFALWSIALTLDN